MKTIEKNTVLINIKYNYEVIFKNMVNDKEFRTIDDFQYYISDFYIKK